MSYVQKVDPQIMEQFVDHAPNQVRFQNPLHCDFSQTDRGLLASLLPLLLDYSSETGTYSWQVVEAMRTSISNMIGVLPPHYFDVTVSTMGENLAQLMFSNMMTGAHTLVTSPLLSRY